LFVFILCFVCLHPVFCVLFVFILCFVCLHPVFCLSSSCVLCFVCLHPVFCVLFVFILCFVFCLSSSCVLCGQLLWNDYSEMSVFDCSLGFPSRLFDISLISGAMVTCPKYVYLYHTILIILWTNAKDA
jgi:hypothetical protein